MLGMSGGVDSSVAAQILLNQGYEVIGVTMQIWQDDSKNCEGTCCSLSAVEDARSVANKLGIPYYVMNYKDIFKEKVIDYFIEEYKKGRTPNPCIACNKFLKFDLMLKKAISMGIDYVATGHYAIIEFDKDKGRFLLKKSQYAQKDQSYVLYNFTQEQLARTLMPIGAYPKEEVRKMAQSAGFTSVAAKPDSQEICFIDDNDYAGYISQKIKVSPGNFIDIEGNKLGEHKGIVHYTVGQRKGLGISFGKPMYVLEIDAKSNTIVLGDEDNLFKKNLIAKNVNFISVEKLDKPMKATAKIRYLAKEADATLYPEGENSIKLTFDTAQRAITPGQAVVFYDGDIVVGGGTIERAF